MIIDFLKRQVRHNRLKRAGVLDITVPEPKLMGGWAVWPDCIRPNSVVYGFGVGNSVAWDLEMIQRFGVTVHAFDPTPASISWVAEQKLPPRLVFHDFGIANFDGMLNFYSPRRGNKTHYSHVRRGGLFDRHPPVPGRVYRLGTIMRKLGHQRINVLKLDIEGSEFEAIPDLIESGIEVDQLLVEIHYQFRTRSFGLGLDLIQRLKNYGMQCWHISSRCLEFSFIRCDLATAAPVSGPAIRLAA